MPILDDTAMFKKLKNEPLSTLYLLYGQESYFVKACVDKIIEKAVPKSFEGFALNRFQGEKLSMEELTDAVLTLPMMTDKKCVVVKDLDIDAMKKDEFDSLLDLLKNPNESTVLVLYAISAVYDVKKAKLKKVAELVQKSGVVCDFALKDKASLKRALCDNAKKAGVFIEMKTAEFLIERCSQSYSILNNEMDKLIYYVKQRDVEGQLEPTEITVKDIEDCCIASIDSSSFDLAKAILSKNSDRAFSLLDELFAQKVEALAIMGALDMCFFDLYRARVALGGGHSVDEVLNDFAYPKNRAFAVRNAFRDARNYSIEALRKCMNILLLADCSLKSSKVEDRLIMETMVCKLSG